jgi:hypothetical protein
VYFTFFVYKGDTIIRYQTKILTNPFPVSCLSYQILKILKHFLFIFHCNIKKKVSALQIYTLWPHSRFLCFLNVCSKNTQDAAIILNFVECTGTFHFPFCTLIKIFFFILLKHCNFFCIKLLKVTRAHIIQVEME